MRIGNIVWSITIFLTVAFAFSLNAQNTDSRKTAFSARAIILGYEVLESDDPLALKDYNSGFEVGIHRVLTDHIQLHIPIRVANIKYLDSIGNDGTFGIDAQLQYHFNDTIKTINPYISAGAGFMQAENNNHVTFPLGAGIDIRLSESAVIGLKADYRLSVEDNKNALAFGIGFKKWIGKNDKKEMPVEVTPIIDTDGDGVEDELDLCPEIAGLKEFQGCPDKDGDGIPDYQDICPEFPGSKEFGGCPDTDGDGIPDNLDECPQIAGTSDNNGCPTQDMDGDGVPDKEDECPEAAGTLANRGCPDKDGDGVIDKEDLCPDSYGTAANYGCPEIEKEEKETLNLAMDAVQFETGEANLKAESFSILNDIAQILKKYPDYYLRITGHTDNVGRESSNQILSEKRARACYEYLASRGIKVSRMSYVGIGETRPRATNDTAEGRYRNRRVEFSLYIPR